MSDHQQKYHEWFHKFMIFFALWVFGAFAILYGIRHIIYVTENGASHMTLDIILSILLIILGIFIFKIRFDLAAMRERSIKELTGACIAAAFISLAFHWVEDISGEDCYQGCIFKTVVFVCWGIALYRYYSARKNTFREY